MSVLFCTTNKDKFGAAKLHFDKAGIPLKQHVIEVDEIQSEDPVRILENKARQIYEKVNQPLIVSDDSWSIPALNGFPGPYMKSMDHWFEAWDWINLMKNHSDKRIFLEKRAAYIDYTGITHFNETVENHFLDEPANVEYVTILRVIRFADSSISIAETWLQNPDDIRKHTKMWQDIIKWYKSQSLKQV